MCKFFSFVTEPEYHGGKRFYFDWKYRKQNLNMQISGYSYNSDSHSLICKHYNLNEDICNKYEFSPLKKEFKIDQINSTIDDRIQAEEWVNKLNFKKVVEPFIIKDVVNPFSISLYETNNINAQIVLLLKNWSNVHDRTWRYLD